MNRLTRRDLDGDPFLTPCDYKELLERLAAYEDTGLEPETCAEYAKAEAEGRYIMLKEPERDGVHRLQEIAQADIEGRVIVLPCKVGDTVYEPTNRGTVSEYRIRAFRVELFDSIWAEWDIISGFVYRNINGFNIDELGKTVFLTREEAGRALEEEQK